MTEFVSRWLAAEPAEPAETQNQRTDKTDRINSVSSVSGSNVDSERCEPLDSAIIANEAGRRSLEEIKCRLDRLTAQAASPTATDLDRQLVADWAAIRDAKLAGEQVA